MEKSSSYKKFLVLSAATLGGIGYLPLLQGTAASLIAAVVFLYLKNDLAYFILTTVSLGVAFISSSPAEKIFKRKDARQIVIDDFAGLLLGFIFLPHTLVIAVGGFFIFRVFDSLKIYPADYFEQLDGSLGVVGDDIVAGLYTLLVLNVLLFLRVLF